MSKDTTKDIRRIKLKLKSEQSKPLSGWELQEFIKTMNKGYSKLDLINEISKLINEGEKPENIIIIDKSYDINHTYGYLKNTDKIDLNKKSMVENFYYLGTPVSMYPNKKIKEIGIVFSLYREIYTIFNRENIPGIEKDKLKEYINLDINEAITTIERDSKNIMAKLKTANKNIFNATKDKLNEKISSARKELNEYTADEYKREVFKKINDIERKELKDEDKLLYSNLERKYYNKFFKLLNEVDRPIILQYQEEDNKLKVIKKEYILNDVESENFLDFKDYSHNSPFVITIIAGVTISLILGILHKTSEDDKKNEEKEVENKEIEDEIDKTIENIILKLANSPELNNTDKVEDKFVKDKLEKSKDRVNKNIENTLSRRSITKENTVVYIDEYRACKNEDTSTKNNL